MTALEWASLLGTLVFAASGALLGVRKGFDLLGVVTLGAVTAVGGGSLRDTLLGTTPPLWFKDERYLWAALLGALLAFALFRRLEKHGETLEVLDALGLALFAASGAQQGINLGLGPLGVIFVGTVSGVGGGVIRDLLAGELPRVFLPGELYASTAAVGALAMYVAAPALDDRAVLLLGAGITLVLRLVSRRYRLRLPARTLKKP